MRNQKQPNKNKRKLRLSASKRIAGLFLYCNRCKLYYSNHNKACNHELSYRAKISVPASLATKRNECRVEILKAENYKDAIKEFFAYKESLINSGYARSEKTNWSQYNPAAHNVDENDGLLLAHAMAKFMAYMRNENVLSFEKKQRGEKGLVEIKRCLDMYIEAIEGQEITFSGRTQKIRIATLKFVDVDKNIVDLVYKYVTTRLTPKGTPYQPKTINNVFAIYKQFTSRIITMLNLKYQNPFLLVKKLDVEVEPQSISMKEFDEVLKLVNHENGWPTSGKDQSRNFYRPWLKDAFELGLYTGGRREEVASMKWSGIFLDDENRMALLKVNHLKRNRARGNYNDESLKNVRIKRFTIHEEFEQCLTRLGYEKYKNTDQYIIAPTLSREHIMSHTTEAFSHYYKLLNTGLEKTFKLLRKTYATKVFEIFGIEGAILTDHDLKGLGVFGKHYLDKDKIFKDAAKKLRFREKKNENPTPEPDSSQ